MEALEVLAPFALLGGQEMNLRELVTAKEVLERLEAALKGRIIYAVIDP